MTRFASDGSLPGHSLDRPLWRTRRARRQQLPASARRLGHRVRQQRPDDDHAVGAGICPGTLSRGPATGSGECQWHAADLGDLDRRPGGCAPLYLAGDRHSDRWEDHVGTIVTSPQELDAFVAAHPDEFAAYDYRVPTGVFLQSFEFLNTNNVEIAGFVWQSYGPEIPDHVMRGVVLPEAVERGLRGHGSLADRGSRRHGADRLVRQRRLSPELRLSPLSL